MNKPIIRVCLAALLGLPMAASAQTYAELDQANSTLGFTYTQMGVSLDGKFPRFDASLTYDPAAPASATTRVVVPLAPIDTGSAEGDAEVQGKDWFATDTHPTASFTSTSVEAKGPGQLLVTGTLSIKGNDRTVSVPVSVTEANGTATFDGTLKINRTDFGVGAGIWGDPEVVAHEVSISFHLVAAPEAQ